MIVYILADIHVDLPSAVIMTAFNSRSHKVGNLNKYRDVLNLENVRNQFIVSVLYPI